MSKKTPVTRNEYKEKFDKLFSKKMNYIPQANEEIRQCKPPYADYYFLSSECYLFSVSGKKLKIMKLHTRKTGKKNSDGNRAGIDWYYVMTVNGRADTKVSAHKLMLDIFNDKIEHNPQFSSYANEEKEGHHIIPRNEFKENEGRMCNRLANLQALPKTVHKRVGYYSSRTEEQIDAEIEEKVKKAGVPIYQCTDLKNLLYNALSQCDGELYINGQAIPITFNDINDDTNKK